MREAASSLAVRGVEGLDVDSEPPRVAADLVQGEQADIPVERRVLDTLGHHRSGRLLKSRHELSGSVLFEHENLPNRLGQVRCRRAVEIVDAAGTGVDVRAIDEERSERLLQLGNVDQAPQSVDLGLKRRADLLDLRLLRHLRKRTPFAGQLREQGLGGRVDEQRLHVAGVLVPGRALDGPVAQLLTRLQDLLDPDPLDAVPAEPLQIAAWIGKSVDVIDAQAGDAAFGDEVEHHSVADLEHVRVLDADAGEVVHVEEPPDRACVVVEIEEPAAQLGVAPERVLLFVRRHVVGHDVEDDVEARVAERPQLAGATELFRNATRVDDVVAVARARAVLAAPARGRGG